MRTIFEWLVREAVQRPQTQPAGNIDDNEIRNLWQQWKQTNAAKATPDEISGLDNLIAWHVMKREIPATSQQPVATQARPQQQTFQSSSAIDYQDWRANKNNPNWGGGKAQQAGFTLATKNVPGLLGTKKEYVWIPPPGYQFRGGEKYKS